MTETGTLERITFVRAVSGRFQLGPSALATLQRYRQDGPASREAGGVLLGRHIEGTDDMVVDDVTEPMPGDRRGWSRFFRARARHQAAIDRAWQESDGTATYLGEWHTHPEPAPQPSCTDWANWKRKLMRDRYTEPIFFAIVGTEQLCVWEGRCSNNLVELEKV